MRSTRRMIIIGLLPLVIGFAYVCWQERRSIGVVPFAVDYPTVSFELKQGTSASDAYNKFIQDMRDKLKSPDGLAKFGIPMMRSNDAKTITDSNRFLLVELWNFDRRDSVKLALRVSDAYVVGYCCGRYNQKTKKKSAWFFTPENPEFKRQNELLFNGKDMSKEDLGFKYDYNTLGDRETIPLGWGPIDGGVAMLAKTVKGQDMKEVKKVLAGLIQTVAEATRYDYISKKVGAALQVDDQFTPEPLLLCYENYWGDLSVAVANSNGKGIFKNPVELKYRQGEVIKTVVRVDQIKDDLSLLKFVK